MKKWWWIILIVVIVAGTWLAGRGGKSDENIVTREILHWHSYLKIFIKGEQQVIPTNIGLSGVHLPIHTHDDTGEIHMEWEQPPVVVYKDDIRLGRLFRNWGRTFNQNCIFDYCNGAEGQVKFFVNGQANTEFDNYIMADKDQLEIRYE